jgi:hypothetical protein
VQLLEMLLITPMLTLTDANDDDSSPDMGDLFADPDPLDTFHLEYTLPVIKSVNEALALR